MLMNDCSAEPDFTNGEVNGMLRRATVPTSHNQNSGLEYLLVSTFYRNQSGSLPASRLPIVIRKMPNWITSESPTIRAEQLRENIRKPTELIRRP